MDSEVGKMRHINNCQTKLNQRKMRLDIIIDKLASGLVCYL